MRDRTTRAWLPRMAGAALVVVAVVVVGRTSAQSAPTPSATSTPNACRPGMVFIQGATVTLGEQKANLNHLHTVTLQSYCIDEHEVSVAQFVAWSGQSTGCPGLPGSPNECATFTEAGAYCASKGLRLPTDDEWEYAARGPQSLDYPWGTKWVQQPPSLGAFATDRSPFGVYGMFGRPPEWSTSTRCTAPGRAGALRSLLPGNDARWLGILCMGDPFHFSFRCAK